MGCPYLVGHCLVNNTTIHSFLEEEVGVCIEVGGGTICEVQHKNIWKATDLVMVTVVGTQCWKVLVMGCPYLVGHCLVNNTTIHSFLEEEVGVCIEVGGGTICEVQHKNIWKATDLVMVTVVGTQCWKVLVMGCPYLVGHCLVNNTTIHSFLEEEVGVCIEVGGGTICEVQHKNIWKATDLVMVTVVGTQCWKVLVMGCPYLVGHCLVNNTTIHSFLEEEVGVCIEVGGGTICEVQHKNIWKATDLVMGKNEKIVEMRKKAC
ncbi:hypothetical protein FRX31_013575 [Thalictrum thalictroides]|uniref:Uncharacterized protein n=1 Tax=Thalictrum thalictroides TaxID=46969 RepID=A0A7J6WIS1_THATH|nr:hypothetical protein FRX31_013575 [Thalictrum thalictroides]